MKHPLQILHLEDDPQDTEMVQALLEEQKVACSVTRAQGHKEFISALERDSYDLVIADYSLPGFDGMSALKITRAKWPDLPFILMSGKVGEEFAIESLKSGATDYVLKDRCSRLVPAVRRAMREVEEKVKHKRLEEQFIQAQKMEVLGQLSGGVAHDFNNILGIIIGNNDFVMSKLRSDDPLRKNLEEIRLAAERAAAVARQLLVFSRNQVVQPGVIDLNEVVRDMDKMLSRLIGENVELKVVLEGKVGRIVADSGYVGQLLMNLVINARDAMINGGRLTISTKNVTLDKAFTHTREGLAPGPYVMLSISDTGMGMTNEVKARLFEAFFTTKPKGKGTGLGLTTCLTIARQFNAYIDVESEPGKGATFSIYFPRVDQPLKAVTQRLPSLAPQGGTETLLVVEDEVALRHMMKMALENLGYKVLEASSGQDGLRMANEHQGPPIALVITDVIMPQMGGKVMVEWLKTTCPELKVLYTSGYTDSAIVHHGVLDEGVAFLPKPYTLGTLASKVREVLDGAPS